MTIAEELHRMGIPEAECSGLAEKIMDAAVVSGAPNAINHMLAGLRILTQNRKAAPEITITTPNYFEDDEVCGYCQRQPGEKHESWCRQ